MNFSAILYFKENSERLPHKNFLEINNLPLYKIIFEKLYNIPAVSEVVINTDSGKIRSDLSPFPNAIIIPRKTQLLHPETGSNDLIADCLPFCTNEHILVSHATNPLLKSSTIEEAIKTYSDNLDKYDSLFSVIKLQNRIYDAALSPVNHIHEKLKRTQDLPPIYIENSSLFIFSKSVFQAKNNRIGNRPFAFEMNPIEAIDIDYREDYQLAQLIYENRNQFGI